MTATIHNLMDKMIKDDEFNENEKEILKYVLIASCCVKSAKNYPQGRKPYLRHCRDMLEKAMIYLDEELEDDREA